MGIFPLFCAQLNLLDICRRFSPFSNEACKLPTCHVYFYEKAEELPTTAEFSAFSAYLARCARGEAICGELAVNEYRFAPLGDGIALRDGESAHVWVHNGFRRIEAVLPERFSTPHQLARLIMCAYQYTALHSGALLLHAAAVEYRGEGIAFCGLPGAGKSSQSLLWQRVYGARAVNNDQPCVFFEDNRAFVHGSPWSGKEPCYRNEFFPLRAIVFVEQSEDDTLQRLPAAQAFSLLYLNNRIIALSAAAEEAYCALIERVATAVPVYRQRCTLSERAPRAAHKALFGKE